MTTKIKTLFDKMGKNKKHKKEEKSKHQYTFSRDFIVGIIEIEKKHIKNFIKGEALNYLQTEDYYYGYFYKEGKLHYVAHKSDKSEAGKVSRLAYILMHEGQFYIVDNKTVYRFVHKDGSISQSIDYTDAVEFDDKPHGKIINIENKEISDPPETLVMKWSLAPKSNYFGAICIASFVGALAFYMSSSSEYKAITQQAEIVKHQMESQQIAKSHDAVIDMSQLIKRISQQLNGRGKILSAKGLKNEITFTIQMNNENDARTFMIENQGGKYENGKVVFTAKYTPVK
jgi:hypothetical protein